MFQRTKCMVLYRRIRYITSKMRMVSVVLFKAVVMTLVVIIIS